MVSSVTPRNWSVSTSVAVVRPSASARAMKRACFSCRPTSGSARRRD
jgi:hypothetical protein